MNHALINYLSKKRYLLPTLITLLTLGTLALTLIPGDYFKANGIWSYDKAGHLLLFGSWTYLIGLYYYISSDKKLHLFTIFIIGVAFGIAVELLQYLLPLNREAELFDIAFDALGSLISILILKRTLPDS